MLISDDEEDDHEPEEGDVGAEEEHDIKDPICIDKKEIEHESNPPEKEEEEEEVPTSGIETE